MNINDSLNILHDVVDLITWISINHVHVYITSFLLFSDLKLTSDETDFNINRSLQSSRYLIPDESSHILLIWMVGSDSCWNECSFFKLSPLPRYILTLPTQIKRIHISFLYRMYRHL